MTNRRPYRAVGQASRLSLTSAEDLDRDRQDAWPTVERSLSSCRLSKLLSLALLLATPVAWAQANPATAFDLANTLYAQGKFADAATNYAALIESGRASPAVYFNLGNAYFKLGQIGRAIASYRQAQELTPRDPDIQANLKFARERVRGPASAPPAWHRILGKLSLNEWTLGASTAAWGWLLLLALGQWRPAWKPLLRNYALVAGLATLGLFACVGARLYWSRSPPAIVITPEAAVRQAPVAESEKVFTAQDGAELPVADLKDEWLQVRPARNRIGWIRKDQVLIP